MLRIIKLMIASLYPALSKARRSIFPSTNGYPQSALTVLLYHEVKAEHRDRFARQMDELLKCAIPVALAGNESPKEARPRAAITFDDGFQSVAANALPELAKRNIPCRIFVPTGYLGQHPGWVSPRNRGRRCDLVMTESQLKHLPEDLVTVGSHSVTHSNLRLLSVAELRTELQESKQRLEEITGRKIISFAFPYGLYNQRVLEACNQAGYEQLFQDKPASRASARHASPTGRINVSPTDWNCEFRLKALGCYNYMSSLASLKREIWHETRQVLSLLQIRMHKDC